MRNYLSKFLYASGAFKVLLGYRVNLAGSKSISLSLVLFLLLIIPSLSFASCCIDFDGDGYSDPKTCRSGTDCDDDNVLIFPGVPGCNNCKDLDDDGYFAYDPINCSLGADCDDTNSEVNPGKGNCNQCVDSDNDGYFAYDSQFCLQGNDCNDGDTAIHPGATEVCDKKDNNCDAVTDENLRCEGCSTTNVSLGSSANYYSGNLFDSFGLNLAPSVTLYYNSLDAAFGPLGRGWTHRYNASVSPVNDIVLAHRESDGRKVYYYKDADGIYRPAPATGVYSRIEASGGGYALIEKDGTTRSFNSSGKLASIADRNGNSTVLSYDANGNLLSITDPGGRILSITSAGGKITSISNANGSYAFAYSGDLLASITDPSGNTRSFTYNGGLLATKTDSEGNTTAYSYDDKGRVSLSTSPDGGVTGVAYEPESSTSRVTRPGGGVWTYEYDEEKSAPLTITDPEGNVTSYTYDEYANVLSETAPDGAITAYTYDDNGNVLTITDAQGNTTSYGYNEYSEVTSITDADGNTTSYVYDANGNLASVTDARGGTTRYEYDAKGNVIEITDAEGRATSFTYDEHNNLISLTGPDNGTTVFTYDANGNMTGVTDSTGATTGYDYNNLNQLIKLTDPQGNVTLYSYDANGNRASETDANGNATLYEYDYKGNLTKVTDALGNVTRYTYGGAGCASCGNANGDKLTFITDANGNITSYEYDTLGRLTKETDPLGNAISYSYDSRARFTSKTDAEGNTINYSYDGLGRLLKKTYPDGTIEVFTYDSRGNIITAGNQHISYIFTYDAAGRVTRVVDSIGRTITYAYDAIGKRTAMTYPDGSVVNYNYNEAGRLAAISPSPLAGEGAFGFVYDSLGRRTSLGYPNGAIANYSYDTAGRLTTLTHKTSSGAMIDSFAYTLDNVGNRLVRGTPGNTAAYDYDRIYRLLSAAYSNGGPTKIQNESYTYDPSGNRLLSSPNRVYTYNAANELTSYKGKAYGYDRNGNLSRKADADVDLDLEAEGWTYQYDYESRLAKAVKAEKDETLTITFRYDPFGRRTEKRVEGVDKGVVGTRVYSYLYDNEDVIMEQTSATSTSSSTGALSSPSPLGGEGWGEGEITKYLHGPGIDEPLSMTNAAGTFYYHADGLGSVVALTDSTGKVAQAYEYDAFGRLHDRMNAVKQPYAFTGREWDRETGFYYYRARYYDAETGRFISKDPIGFAGGVNLYGYVGNNPAKYGDPLGLLPVDDEIKKFDIAFYQWKQGNSFFWNWGPFGTAQWWYGTITGGTVGATCVDLSDDLLIWFGTSVSSRLCKSEFNWRWTPPHANVVVTCEDNCGNKRSKTYDPYWRIAFIVAPPRGGRKKKFGQISLLGLIIFVISFLFNQIAFDSNSIGKLITSVMVFGGLAIFLIALVFGRRDEIKVLNKLEWKTWKIARSAQISVLTTICGFLFLYFSSIFFLVSIGLLISAFVESFLRKKVRPFNFGLTTTLFLVNLYFFSIWDFIFSDMVRLVIIATAVAIYIISLILTRRKLNTILGINYSGKEKGTA